MKMWVRTRVAQAIMGALLIGGVTVTVIVWPSLQLGLRTGAPAGFHQPEPADGPGTLQRAY